MLSGWLYSLSLSTYICVLLSIITLWFPRVRGIPLWWVFLLLTGILGLVSRIIQWPALLPLFYLGGACYLFELQKARPQYRFALAAVVVLFGLVLISHNISGFDNHELLDYIKMSRDSFMMPLYYNVDKALVGVLILGLTHRVISSGTELVNVLKKTFLPTLLLLSFLILVAFSMRFIIFDPKWPGLTIVLRITASVFIGSFAEEVYFRGFIQKNLTEYLGKFNHGYLISIFATSLFFGLMHLSGGLRYFILTSIASAGFGWVYHKTQRVEASILTHAVVNIGNFLLFTYPFLLAPSSA